MKKVLFILSLLMFLVTSIYAQYAQSQLHNDVGKEYIYGATSDIIGISAALESYKHIDPGIRLNHIYNTNKANIKNMDKALRFRRARDGLQKNKKKDIII